MTAERHLIIQELSLRPSGEWRPDAHGWTVLRVADGAGYCLQGGSGRELNTGDMIICSPATTATIRASQLGALRLEYFLVLPQCLNGLLTVTEWRQMEDLSRQSNASLLHFPAADPSAQKFTRLSAQTRRDCLATRSTLLQLWATSVTNLLPAHNEPSVGGHLRDRFRQLIGKMAEAELASRSLTELAEELHCSERHFSRLFREEFKVSLRSCQTELRLQRARQLLTASNQKVINIAYESGFRHLGLFNAMFKKRFGLTPSAWRNQNSPAPVENPPPRISAVAALALLLLTVFFSPLMAAETTNAPMSAGAVTNGPVRTFTVDHYEIIGNTTLPPVKLGDLFTNVPEAFGTNVTLDGIRAAVKELQTAYRERGFVTVSVGLPPQRITNGIVKIKVTEGHLAVINVTGNDHFSTENVLRALPSLHTNMLLNSHVFQRELDLANSSRDRTIYPVIAPGPDPGTSELTLKVKDRLPLHSRVEYNNSGTVGTPDDRVSFSAEYDNLWQLEHSVGVQYAFSPLDYATGRSFYFSPLDLPQVANYSAYYRMPVGKPVAVQSQIDQSAGRFGYNESTHQFVMPPPTGRPEMTLYASRSVSDSGVAISGYHIQKDNRGSDGLGDVIAEFNQGENITLNEGIGFKYTQPLSLSGPLTLNLLFGADFKRFQQVSVNSNGISVTQYIPTQTLGITNITPPPTFVGSINYVQVDYFPLNTGFSGSLADPWGSTSFNAQANLNLAANASLATAAYTPKARDNYLTTQAGVTRDQRIWHDWDVLLHADGQWANTPLFSNEQYEMGGSSTVRGYPEGAAYGDTGWRLSAEPQTPQVNIGMVDGDVPFYVRSSIFLDYGHLSALKGSYTENTTTGGPSVGTTPGATSSVNFMGTGWTLTANIGSHLDARLTVAFPLLDPLQAPGWDPVSHAQVYFAVGGQF